MIMPMWVELSELVGFTKAALRKNENWLTKREGGIGGGEMEGERKTLYLSRHGLCALDNEQTMMQCQQKNHDNNRSYRLYGPVRISLEEPQDNSTNKWNR